MPKRQKAPRVPRVTVTELPATAFTVQKIEDTKVFALGELYVTELHAIDLFSIDTVDGIEYGHKGECAGYLWPVTGTPAKRSAFWLHGNTEAMTSLIEKHRRYGAALPKISVKDFRLGDTLTVLAPAALLMRQIERGSHRRLMAEYEQMRKPR